MARKEDYWKPENRAENAAKAARIAQEHPDWSWNAIGEQLAREGVRNSNGKPHGSTQVQHLILIDKVLRSGPSGLDHGASYLEVKAAEHDEAAYDLPENDPEATLHRLQAEELRRHAAALRARAKEIR